MFENDKSNIKEKPKFNWRKAFQLPVIGDFLTLCLALLPPFFSQIAVNQIFYNTDDVMSGSHITFAFCLFVWNLLLWMFLKLNLTIPLFHIPWFVIGLGHLIYQLGIFVFDLFSRD